MNKENSEKHSFEKNNPKLQRYYQKREIPGKTPIFSVKTVHKSVPILARAMAQEMHFS